jgi:pimeloyl-ACP methyl ester carboxylesterase
VLSVVRSILIAVTTILVPPLLCSPLAYAPVLDVAWSFGAVSLADTRSDDSIAAMATRLLRDAPERFALVGTSMGGYVALEVVRQAPERVRALALVSTSARADTPEQIGARRQQSQLVEDGQFAALVDAAFAGVVAAANQSSQALLGLWRAMTAAVGPEAFLRQQAAVIGRVDSRALLPSIACPTTVIHGADDRLMPVELGREIAASIPGADLVIIDGAGHFAFSEQPDAGRAAVRNFLARSAGRP